MAGITRRFLGFTSGAAITIALTQGSVTATGQTNPNGWGVAPPVTSAGDFEIVPERTLLQVAPDSVGFTVDLTGTDFDTPAPATQTEYDHRFHKLEYFWTFGDPGTWTAPEKTLPAWKNRNFAYGQHARHMFRAAGTYTVTCFIVEPSSGKTATASLDVVVADPNTVFPTTKTICVNNVGDSDFSAKPTGAQTFNQNSFVDSDALHTAIYNASGAGSEDRVRVLFKAGWTGTVHVGLTSMRSVSFGTYGGSTRATFNADTATPNAYCIGRGGSLPDGDIPDLRVQNINFQGDFNETTHRLAIDYLPTTGGISGNAGMRYMVVDCNFDGLSKQAVSIYTLPDATTNPTGWSMVHLDNIVVTNLGKQYPVFVAGGAENYTNGSHFSMTGCRINKHPDALCDPTAANASPVRQACHDFVHIRGCDLHNSDGGWPALRIVDGDLDGRARAVVHTCALDAPGWYPLAVSGSQANRPGEGFGKAALANILVDGNIMVGGWSSEYAILFKGAGMTARNNLMIQPAMPCLKYAGFLRFIAFENPGPNADYLTFPNRVYNNTMVCQRSQANNEGNVPLMSVPDPAAFGVTLANNVIHQPNMNTPQVTYAPLSTDVLFASRNEGRRPVYHEIITTLEADVPNGGTVALAYDGAAAYRAVDYAEHQVDINYGWPPKVVTLSYGASTVTITNASGAPWPSGAALRLRLYNAFGHYRAKQTAYATGNVLAYAPLTGSAAIGAATGTVTLIDLLGRIRPGTLHPGAAAGTPSLGALEPA